MKRQRGMTLIEMLMALGVFSLVLLSFAGLFSFLNMQVKKIDMRSENSIEAVHGTRASWMDMADSFPSFNNLAVPDDGGRNFFDYYPDVSDRSFSPEARTRQLTLHLQSRRDVVFLVNDDRRGKPALYDPVRAYQVGEPPEDLNLEGPLTYVSVNNANYMQNIGAQMWREGQLMMLFSPVYLRDIRRPANDHSRPPRMPAFLARVGSSDLDEETLGGLFPLVHPSDPSLRYSGPDAYFRLLPGVAGGAPMVFAQPVRAIRYALEPTTINGRPTAKLTRRTWVNGVFPAETEYLMSSGVERVVFRRASVSVPEITLRVLSDNLN